MNIEKFFEGVDTSNINIKKVEELSKEIPNINSNILSIEQNYESFYKEYESKLSCLNDYIDNLPLMNLSHLFVKTKQEVSVCKFRKKFKINQINSHISVVTRKHYFLEKPRKIRNIVAYDLKQNYIKKR